MQRSKAQVQTSNSLSYVTASNSHYNPLSRTQGRLDGWRVSPGTQSCKNKKAGNGFVHPALVRYTKRIRTKYFLSDGRKRSDRSPVAAAARRTGPEQTGTRYLRNGPEFQSYQKSTSNGNKEGKNGHQEKTEMKRRKPGRRRERNFSFGTGSRTEPEPSEPAAAVSDAVPLRASQTNPITARNRSPSTSPVHEAHSDKVLFVRWQKAV